MNKDYIIILLIISFVLFSCKSSYIDEINGQITINNGYLISNAKENIFYYSNDVYVTSGNEKYKSPDFKIQLPKNIHKINVINGTDFLIEFNKRQYIFIKINKMKKYKNELYNYTKNLRDKDMIDKYLILEENKVKVLNFRLNHKFSNDFVEISLLNILEKSNNHFLNLAKTFKFIN